MTCRLEEIAVFNQNTLLVARPDCNTGWATYNNHTFYFSPCHILHRFYTD